MIIGVPKETKADEYRVAMLPSARQLAALGVDDFAAGSPGHAAAVNMRDGKLTNAAVAEAFGDLPR